MLDAYFRVKLYRTSLATEAIAGLTTFLTMVYILVVTPNILAFRGVSGLEGSGLPIAQTVAVTALGAGLMTIAMGLSANYPFALAPGIGVSVIVAFSLVAGRNLTWGEAMGVIFYEGIIITILVLTGVRQWIMDAIPISMKRAIGAGVGLFIALVGAQNAGLIQRSSTLLLTFGDIRNPVAGLALIGLVITAALLAFRFRGALLVGLAVTTILGAFPVFHQTVRPEQIVGMPDFTGIGRIDYGVIWKTALWMPLLAILLTDFFDSMGTVVAVGGDAGFLDERGHLPRLRRVLSVDALAAAFGGFLRCSSLTTRVESASGISTGGRTGLSAIVTGVLFLAAIVVAPVFSVVPAAAAAPVLIVVGAMMLAVMRGVSWDDPTEALPAFVTVMFIPFTFDITRGIGYGFIVYTAMKLLTGRWRQLHPATAVIAVLFLLSFAFIKV